MHTQNEFSHYASTVNKRENLNIESAKGILLLQYNYKRPSGKEFHGCLRTASDF